ncbi:MAG: hypothetical protein ACKV2T_22380 [Kofleriaceae bacterium]
MKICVIGALAVIGCGGARKATPPASVDGPAPTAVATPPTPAGGGSPVGAWSGEGPETSFACFDDAYRFGMGDHPADATSLRCTWSADGQWACQPPANSMALETSGAWRIEGSTLVLMFPDWVCKGSVPAGDCRFTATRVVSQSCSSAEDGRDESRGNDDAKKFPKKSHPR